MRFPERSVVCVGGIVYVYARGNKYIFHGTKSNNVTVFIVCKKKIDSDSSNCTFLFFFLLIALTAEQRQQIVTGAFHCLVRRSPMLVLGHSNAGVPGLSGRNRAGSVACPRERNSFGSRQKKFNKIYFWYQFSFVFLRSDDAAHFHGISCGLTDVFLRCPREPPPGSAGHAARSVAAPVRRKSASLPGATPSGGINQQR